MPDYKKLLEDGYAECKREAFEEKGYIEGEDTYDRLEFLGARIFDFTTYDGTEDAKWARRAVEVCGAISNRTTFKYQALSEEHYTWFLLMCNMSFFAKALSWGGSIRGAWWSERVNCHGSHPIKYVVDVFYVDGKQQVDWEFTLDEWTKFIAAIIEFAKPEMEEPTS